ncbi:protein adenylyltransferase SelO [Xanthomonas hortorum]|uniref:protein adenylyltransferase SelO n=1 Tax=Xanthomonas hortorum TaxID=56454 RepID=UPI0015D63EF1|nr:YdiU family protein [Xanthomonas hortorum]MCE4360240.1 YdiU family protein [Xanthomonas hortorum pv. taraxaci]NMI50234.1 YdiU family protein [Xanthomonas hortorum pv. taraxaci]CAD0327099.1 Protein adenylyltransferase SelO [Xanthomonas hortorum pv. taraxaci]CAD0327104.1 Protein adenylyltransferase SelO [Xanthomonas hortorum pv. taraxaci]
MTDIQFDNRLRQQLPGDPEEGPRRRDVVAAWSSVSPTPVAAPRLLAYSAELAQQLGLDEAELASARFAEVFGGNALYPGMQPWAVNYGGHQFGHWAGQLGDGRAISLGEAIGVDGVRYELQLKGAGPTPYSRGADGRAVLRSSIREFLCSEAMHHLGVPTTRALSLVTTGDAVVRDMFYDGRPQREPGAIVCRVAPSFIRFGNFELPSARGDSVLLRQWADFTIARDFPELEGAGENLYAAWFAQVCERTAVMVAHWMRVGFVHGVMNTDNMSILGLTIDYGPYGWVDDYDPDWTPNTTDAQGRRYRFGTQPQVAYWNLGRLAQALAPLFADAAPLQQGLDHFRDTYLACDRRDTAAKLGLADCRNEDLHLIDALRELMHAAEMDMTLTFRGLIELSPEHPDPELLREAFYDQDKRLAHAGQLQEWLQRYATRLGQDTLSPDQRRERMRLANPRYVLRNYLAQQAIDLAEQGDPSGVQELLEVMRRPCDDQPGRDAFAARRPEWARDRAGCSMLSCSS